MFRSNVKINENMLTQEYDLEGEACPSLWGQFVDLTDPSRKCVYRQKAPKIKASIPPAFSSIYEEEYEFEESDYQVDTVPKISTIGLLMNTIYILHYVLCKLPGKFWSN
tara:strand:- start:1498 stop:1824 length:327 start_codon:yes stop_codon:yes gene_type:complete